MGPPCAPLGPHGDPQEREVPGAFAPEPEPQLLGQYAALGRYAMLFRAPKVPGPRAL